MLVVGVLLFLTQGTSRREGNRPLTEPKSWTTLPAAFPQSNTVPHRDTVANVLEKIPSGEVETVLTDTMKDLLPNRRLERWRVQQRSLIAIDGTLKWCGIVPHAPEMLQKHSTNGPTIYPGYGVEAVLVGPQGMAIPLLTELCANSEEPTEETQQDSELVTTQGFFAGVAAHTRHRVMNRPIWSGLRPSAIVFGGRIFARNHRITPATLGLGS